jgi:hypothetical protein
MVPVTTFGSSPAFSEGSEFDKAWDGKTSTFFDGPEDGFTVADFGTAFEIVGIEYFPRAEWEGRMQGGLFEGASESEQGPWTRLHEISRQPKLEWTGALVDIAGGKFRWVRYSARKTSFREGGFGNVADIRVRHRSLPHPCDDGSHDCDAMCYRYGDHSSENLFKCESW